MARPFRGTTATDRFWSRVERGDGCWLWTGHIGPRNRYGAITVDGRHVKAHRFSYELHHGPIPEGAVVRHTCDTPRCVRPDHLTLGTQADNVADAISRGRFTRAPRDWHGRFARLADPELPTESPRAERPFLYAHSADLATSGLSRGQEAR